MRNFYRKVFQLLVVMAVLCLVVSVAKAALTIPSNATNAFIQTTGRLAGSTVGDYRTNSAGDDLPHQLNIMVPCTPNQTYVFQIFDPAMDVAGNAPGVGLDGVTNRVLDEVRNTVDQTHYQLFSPGGATLANINYAPGTSDQAWTTLGTVTLPAAPVAGVNCGTYVVQTSTGNGSAVVGENDDDNGWRFRLVGGPGLPPAETFDPVVGPDGIAGTGDESIVGILSTSYQHPATGCQSFYWFADDGETNMYMLNFDMDVSLSPAGTVSATYITPSGTNITGTVSDFRQWNDPAPPAVPPNPNPQPRPTFAQMNNLFNPPGDTAGDAIVAPESGQWQANICINQQNQYSFEVPQNTVFLNPLVLPVVAIAKTDGVTTVTSPGSTSYTLTLTNSGNGAALSIPGPEVVDTLPAGMTFVSCTVNAPLVGTCAESAPGSGIINADLTPQAGILAYLPGVADAPKNVGTITVNANINAGVANGINLTNTATVDFTDVYGNNHPPKTATDTDTVTGAALQADLQITKTDGVTTYTPGGTLTYTIVVRNVGPDNVTGATVGDTFPAGIASASWTCTPTGTATCTAGPVNGNITDTVNINAGAGNFLTYTVTANVAVGAAGALTNTATVTTPPGTTDPTPGNNTATDIDNPAGAPQADLQLTKTDGVTTYTPGGALTYTVVVSNAGPNAVTGATVGDTLPAGIASASWTCAPSAGAACTAGPVAGNIADTVNIPNGGTLTYTITANVAVGAAGTLTNAATVTPPPGTTDPNPGNNTGTDIDNPPPQQADLQITKDDGVVTYTPGGTLTYTVVVTNAGPNGVTGGTVSDTFPAAIASASWTCVPSAGAACTAGPVAGNITDTVNIPNGGTLTYTVTANVAAGAAGALTNTATVATPPGVTDPTPGNNTTTDTDTPANPQTDLSITKDDGVTTYTAGGVLTYTMIVRNLGPSGVTGATVNDTFPAGIASASWTCVPSAGAACTAGPVAGNIADTVNIPNGGTLTYTITANVAAAAAGTLTNTATVAPPAGVTETNPNNNTAVDVDAPVGAPQADLSIAKDDGTAVYTAGGTLTYTVLVRNLGPDPVTGATVNDTFPAAIASASWTCVPSAGATCTAGPVAGNIADTVNIPVNGTLTYTVTANVAAGAVGALSNTATVATPPGVTDVVPGNNTSTDTDTPGVGAQADLRITKSNGVTSYTPGGTLTYQIVVSNAGPSNVTGATVSDPLSPSFIAPTNWTCTPTGTATCTPAGVGAINDTVNINVGASVTYTITTNVALAAQGVLTNTASVALPPGFTDPTPRNNKATDNDNPPGTNGSNPVVVQVDPFITKSVNPPFAIPGEGVTWTIIVTNPGTITATNITVQDAMPSEIEILSTSASAGSVNVSGQTVTFHLASLGAGQSATVTISAQVRKNIGVPFVIRNLAVITNNEDPTARTTEATLLSVSKLPQTGESPWWRLPLLALLGEGVVVLAAMLALLWKRTGARQIAGAMQRRANRSR